MSVLGYGKRLPVSSFTPLTAALEGVRHAFTALNQVAVLSHFIKQEIVSATFLSSPIGRHDECIRVMLSQWRGGRCAG